MEVISILYLTPLSHFVGMFPFPIIEERTVRIDIRIQFCKKERVLSLLLADPVSSSGEIGEFIKGIKRVLGIWEEVLNGGTYSTMSPQHKREAMDVLRDGFNLGVSDETYHIFKITEKPLTSSP